MTTCQKGDIAVLKVAMRALEKGWIPSRPIPESARYDIVLDDGERLYRCQVKWADGSPKNGGSVICQLTRHNGSGVNTNRKYHSGEVDAVLVYLPKLDVLCWLEPEDFEGKSGVSLRYEPTMNGQTSGCIMVQDRLW